MVIYTHIKNSFLCLVCLVVSLMSYTNADDLEHLSGAGNEEKLDRLAFSGVYGEQRWDRRFKAYTLKRTHYLARTWKRDFVLPLPPANSSERTRREVDYLMTLLPQRNQKQKEIEAEVLINNFKWGDFTYEQLTTNEKFKHTSKLVLSAYNDMGVVCFVFKEKFNRIRPSLLAKKFDMRMGTVVAIPGHPAYPSGHATGAFTIAYLLQQLDPENGEQYRKDAERIAKNREVGGLHYPSDTEAGRLLARQIVDSLLENKQYLEILTKAKLEW